MKGVGYGKEGDLVHHTFHRREETLTGFKEGSGITQFSCRKMTVRIGGGWIVGSLCLFLVLKESQSVQEIMMARINLT